jgi:type IV pilus assembly protein PilY1
LGGTPTAASPPNGLGGVTLVRNSKKEVTTAYAGDLQGNLWRVDFGDGADPSTWTVGFNGDPLFTATDNSQKGTRQPITAAPVVAGEMIVVGTGSLLTKEDQANTGLQSIYGIWLDPQRKTTVSRSKLVAQTISKTVENGLYQLSSHPVNLGSDKDWGWLIDLDIEPKQRVIYPLQAINNLVYVPTVVPASPVESACDPVPGVGYSFLLPAATGGQLSVPVFDTNGDNKVTSADALGSGFKTIPDGPSKILLGPKDGSIQNTGEKDIHFDPCAAGGPNCDKTDTKKFNITDRVWQQLVNPPF